MSKYLGIDYGLKRIGIAISDDSKKIAFPREYILNDKTLLEKIISIIREENITKIIIGYPLKFNLSETHITKDVEEFEKKLKNKIGNSGLVCETILYDERLTSNLAASDFHELGLKKSKRKEKGIIDSLSARIILQNYLDRIIT